MNGLCILRYMLYLGCNHNLFPMRLCPWMCKSISGCLRTFSNKQSKIVKTLIRLNQFKNPIPNILAMWQWPFLLRKGTRYKLKIGGKKWLREYYYLLLITCHILIFAPYFYCLLILTTVLFSGSHFKEKQRFRELNLRAHGRLV